MIRYAFATAALLLSATTASAQGFVTDTRTDARNTTSAALAVSAPLTADEHLAAGQRALAAGDLRTARRAFKVAALLDREDGRVPTAASTELVKVLLLQGAHADAITELTTLAADAARHNDTDTEARALADVVWLKVEHGGRQTVRADAVRLRALLASSTLSTDTRDYVTQRVR